ncbi:MAG: hypothetical protein U5M51_13105 [Emticicia sp.]|nr:hypothetical protein [Emticicia sp.]
MIEEKKEVLNTKKIDWQKELELFLQADLNKQSYQLSYNKEETPQMAVYTLKEGEKLPVKSLKIIFDEDKNSQAHRGSATNRKLFVPVRKASFDDT